MAIKEKPRKIKSPVTPASARLYRVPLQILVIPLKFVPKDESQSTKHNTINNPTNLQILSIKNIRFPSHP